MDRPIAARPGDLDPSTFRAVGQQVVEAMSGYYAELAERAVLPDVTPDAVAALFAGVLPEQGEAAEALVEDWRQRVAPLLTAVGSPRHFGYVNGSGAMIGAFADALAACTNTNAGAWRLGPAATAIERQCLRWLAAFVGYPQAAGGVLVSGGTMANFTALLTALRHVAPYDTTPEGLQDPRRGGRFLVYMSDHEGHVSVTRVADMLNLGRSAVRPVASRSDLTLDPEALDRALTADRARGDLPFCVVAQLGSVNVGAVDPIAAIADVCARHGVWLHGDGACGLLAAGLDETRSLFAGLERADSVSLDAHKWLGVPNDCGVVLVREAERLRRAFSITAPYLRGDADADRFGLDFLEYGPQMSRGFRALKLWMVLRFFGAAGLRAVLAKNIGLARHLHALVADHPDFQVLHEPALYIYCFRYVPHVIAERTHDSEIAALLDRLNQAIADRITASGLAFVMTTRLAGRIALRLSICSQRTLAEDVDRTFEAIAREGRRLSHEALAAAPPSAA